MPTTPQDRKKSKKNPQKPRPETAQPIPQPEAPDSKYAPNAWVSGGVGSMEDVKVPSGQLCLVRRPGLQGLIKAGVLHNIDSLSALVQSKHLKQGPARTEDGEDKPDELDVTSLMNDPKGLEEVMYVMDKVLCHIVVKPSISMAPNDVTRRQPGVVYADMVDLIDKVFLFNYAVGGSRDLEQFRSGLDDAMGGVEAGEGVQPPAE